MGWWWYYGSIMSNVNNGKKVSLVEENIRSVVEQTMMGGWPHWRTSPSYQRGVEIVHVSAMFVWKPNTSFSNFQQVRGATASTSFDRILFSPSCLVAFVDVSRHRWGRLTLTPVTWCITTARYLFKCLYRIWLRSLKFYGVTFVKFGNVKQPFPIHRFSKKQKICMMFQCRLFLTYRPAIQELHYWSSAGRTKYQ